MGMCKSCGKVFPSQDMKDGYCKSCIVNNNTSIIKTHTYEERKLITLVNKKTNDIKHVPIGFSIATLFFAPIVLIFRGDYTNFWWIFIIYFIFGHIPNIGFIVSIFFSIYLAIEYNKIYIKTLLKNGYEPYNSQMKEMLQEIGIELYNGTYNEANPDNSSNKKDKNGENDIVNRIQKLFELYKDGAITKEEYEKFKADMI